MKKHRLSRINLEQKTAVCAVCGNTKIYVTSLHGKSKPITSCAYRARENTRNYRAKKKLFLQQDLKKLQPRHTLSEIDIVSRRAICALCGPTDVWKIKARGYIHYECATHRRNYIRVYNRLRYVARASNPHALSKIDEEEQTAVCAKCGPVKIEIRKGKKKISRHCINAKIELLEAKKSKSSLGKMEI